jgi:hypothetical protein
MATLSVVLLPLLVTLTTSYGAAREECHDHTVMLLNVTDVDSEFYNPEWDVEGDALLDLFPVHLFNSISTAVSLFGFWVWLFFSPHMSNLARDLDRTCEKPDCILKIYSNVLPPSSSSCLTTTFLLLCSGKLFCPSVAGEPPRCCVDVRVKLRTISHSEHGSYFIQPARDVRPVHHRDEPPVPSLPTREGARRAS